MRLALSIVCFLAAACGQFPHDTEHTSQRVMESGVLRVTIVAGTQDPSPALTHASVLANEMEAAITIAQKPASLALRDLHQGATDLVVGEFGRSSPVTREASLSPAIGVPEPKDGKIPVLRFARKKGENAIITKTDMMVMK